MVNIPQIHEAVALDTAEIMKRISAHPGEDYREITRQYLLTKYNVALSTDDSVFVAAEIALAVSIIKKIETAFAAPSLELEQSSTAAAKMLRSANNLCTLTLERQEGIDSAIKRVEKLVAAANDAAARAEEANERAQAMIGGLARMVGLDQEVFLKQFKSHMNEFMRAHQSE